MIGTKGLGILIAPILCACCKIKFCCDVVSVDCSNWCSRLVLNIDTANAPNIAIAISAAIRATALLIPDAVPASSFSTNNADLVTGAILEMSFFLYGKPAEVERRQKGCQIFPVVERTGADESQPA